MIKKKVGKRILVEKDAALKHEAPVQEEQKAIIVLGMHRSGISAVTGVLNILGVDFGPNLMPAQPDNPEGFQQHPDIVNIHDRILESLNIKWDDVAPFPDNWWKNKVLRPLRNELRETIVRDFAESELWGINDPRMSRLLPLWLSTFREVNCRPHFVHIVRNPVEVSESLRKRQGFARRKSILLWMVHELAAELWTRNLPRVFVSYRQLLENWPGTLEKISEGLGINFPLKISDVVDKVSDFLDLEMKHHNRAEDLWSYDPDTPPCVLKAYSNFENATDGADNDFVSSLSECRAEFESSMLSYPSRTLMEELKQQRSKAGGELTGLSERIGELEESLQERDARLVEASAQLEARTSEVAELGQRASELQNQLFQKEQEVGVLSTFVRQLEERLASLGEELVSRDQELAGRSDRVGQMESSLFSRDFEVTQLTKELDELGGHLGTLTVQLEQVTEENMKSKNLLEEKTLMTASLEMELRETNLAMNERDWKLEQLIILQTESDDQMAKLKMVLNDKDNTLEDLALKVNALESQANGLAESLRSRVARISELEGQLENLVAELKEQRVVLEHYRLSQDENEAQINRLRIESGEKDALLTHLSDRLQEKETQIQNIYLSTSWRLSKPIRSVGKAVKRLQSKQ